jgi:hypothetical protein
MKPASESIAGRLFGRLSDWLGQDRDAADVHNLRVSEVDLIASDLRVSRAELEALVSRGRQRADELSKMLKALGIDESALAHKEPGVLRDMTLLCALCVAKSRCNHELESGAVAQRLHEYCTNSYTIDALQAKPKGRRGRILGGPYL